MWKVTRTQDLGKEYYSILLWEILVWNRVHMHIFLYQLFFLNPKHRELEVLEVCFS